MALLFIISTANPIMTENFSFEDSNSQSTSGRSVHYGDWVAHREIPIEDGCEGYYYGPSEYLIDSSSEGVIAVYSGGCNYDYSDVLIYDVIDFSLIATLENDDDVQHVYANLETNSNFTEKIPT